MPSFRSCCVFGCGNKDKTTYTLIPKVSYYCFPGRRPWELDKRRKWIQFVKREGLHGEVWKPTATSFICSQHFVGNRRSNDPRGPSYYPTIHPISNESIRSEVIKQEPANLDEEEDCQEPLLEQCTTTFQLPLFVQNNTTSTSTSLLTTTCSLCHNTLNDIQELTLQDEETMQARTTFFSQQIYSQINSTNDSRRRGSSNNNVKDCQTGGSFCDSCCMRIDHLHSLHNQLIWLQEEFEQLKTDLVQIFVQGQGVTSSRIPNTIRHSHNHGNESEEIEFKIDDDEESSNNYNIGNAESTCSDSDDDIYKAGIPVKAIQLKSCYVELERIDVQSQHGPPALTNTIINPRPESPVLSSSNTTTTNKAKTPKLLYIKK